MALFDRLVRIGGKLGMVRIVSTSAPPQPKRIPMRTIALKDLAAEAQAQEVRALAQQPSELSVELPRLFEAAGVSQAEHGWTVERLAQLLRDPALKDLDRRSVQQEVLRRLAADRAHVHQVIQDAVARDRALDAFDGIVRRKMADRQALRQRRLAELDAQVQSLRQQMEQIRRDHKDEQAAWKRWRDRKLACEKEMAWAVGFLVENRVITVDEDRPEADNAPQIPSG